MVAVQKRLKTTALDYISISKILVFKLEINLVFDPTHQPIWRQNVYSDLHVPSL